MEWMFISVLAALVVICWLKFMKYKSGLAAYLRYFEEQGMKEPTTETIKEYQKWAIENMIKDFFHSR